MHDLELLAKIAPTKESKMTQVLVMLALTVADRSAFIVFSNGKTEIGTGIENIFSISSGEVTTDTFIEELVKQQAEKGELSALLICDKIFMFPHYIQDEEIVAWGDRPIKEHPEAMEVCTFTGITSTHKKEWTVTFELNRGQYVIKKVYEESTKEEINGNFIILVGPKEDTSRMSVSEIDRLCEDSKVKKKRMH